MKGQTGILLDMAVRLLAVDDSSTESWAAARKMWKQLSDKVLKNRSVTPEEMAEFTRLVEAAEVVS